MTEPLNEHARAWLASGTEMDSEYAQICLEYIEVLERALEIESATPQDRSQEAQRYNWLEDQNEQLTEQLSVAREALIESNVELKKYQARNLDQFGGYTIKKIEKNNIALAKLGGSEMEE